MEAMKKASRLTNKDKGKETRLTIEKYKGKEILDADLWGKLQEHIPLQVIYEKLSQRNLSYLCLVSKEWNHAALQWILPKPSFVFIAPSTGLRVVHFLNGIVTYNSVFGKSKVNHQRLCLLYVKNHVPPFEVEGLILCHNRNDLGQWDVFNVHTQTWHAIPPGPKQRKSACGLLVDTIVKPYTFKLIESNRSFRTQVYDSKSKSWSKTSSWLSPSFRWTILEYSCICHNNDIYISVGIHKILKYCLEDDKWTYLKSPEVKNLEAILRLENTLGVCAGRIFTTRRYDKKQRVTVWELVDSEVQEWVEYARMSNEQYKWLFKHEMEDDFSENRVGLRSFFRDGYLLVCSWRLDIACANELVLFDMATKI